MEGSYDHFLVVCYHGDTGFAWELNTQNDRGFFYWRLFVNLLHFIALDSLKQKNENWLQKMCIGFRHHDETQICQNCLQALKGLFSIIIYILWGYAITLWAVGVRSPFISSLFYSAQWRHPLCRELQYSFAQVNRPAAVPCTAALLTGFYVWLGFPKVGRPRS